jgi:trehalose/maltose hydrolase-like predicted phosphorylase
VSRRPFGGDGEREMSWQLYSDALASDFVDIQGGTTAEGIHAGVMAGTVLIALSTFAGISFDDEFLSLQPSLPDAWESLSFSLTFKGTHFKIKIAKTELICAADSNATVIINTNKSKLLGGKETFFKLN